MAEKNSTIQIIVFLGAIGAAVHSVSLRWSVFQWDPTDTLPPFTHQFVLVMNTTLVVLGALFYALFLKWPVTESVQERRLSAAVVLMGGLWGMSATLSALVGRYLAGACFLTYQVMVGVPGGSLRHAFLSSIMEIGTYGLIETFYFLAPAFLCGALVTATVSQFIFHQSIPQSNPSA